MAVNNPASDVITVWSDIACPWAGLALHTLRVRSQAIGARLRIDHRVFPLEILNSSTIPKAMHDDEVRRIMAVRPDLEWSPWTEPDWEYPVTFVPALHAVQCAKIMGLEASDALDAGLRRAYFVEGRCISLYPVIDDVAQDCSPVDAARLAELMYAGAATAAIDVDRREIAHRQIQGSPHFWTADGPYAANPGVDDISDFQEYDSSWADDLLARVN